MQILSSLIIWFPSRAQNRNDCAKFDDFTEQKKSYTTVYRLSTKFNDLRLISNFLSTFAAVAEQKAIVKIFERIPRGSRIYLHISRISMTQICWFRGLPLRIIEEMLLLINCGWLRRRTKAPRKHILVLTIKGTFTYDRQRWKIPPALCDLGHAIRLSLCHVNVCFADSQLVRLMETRTPGSMNMLICFASAC